MSDNILIQIKNFQSIKEASLLFTKGLTLIVGPTNSGKTAIIRAVQYLLDNSGDGASIITHGESSTEVSYSDGSSVVVWKREAKSSEYEINGESFKKVGKVSLSDLIDINSLGFVLDAESEVLNISDEWDVLFPFDKTSSQIYKLFESTFNISDSSVVLKKIKEDESSLKKSISDKTLELEIKKSHVADLKSFLDEFNSTELSTVLDEFQNSHMELTSLEEVISFIVQAKSSLDRLPEMSVLDLPLDELASFINMDEFCNHLQEVSPIINSSIEPLEFNVEKLENFIKLDELCDYLIANRVDSFEEISPIDMNIEDVLMYLKVSEAVSFIEDCSKEIATLKKEVGELSSELSKVVSELSVFKVCPTCGKPIDMED